MLTAALGDLPERQPAVVELRDVHGFEAEEVRALLDLTPANQRVLLHPRPRQVARGLGSGRLMITPATPSLPVPAASRSEERPV